MAEAKQVRMAVYLALAGAILALLGVFYYMQKLSFFIGDYYGETAVAKIYNLTPTSAFIVSASQASHSIYISYIMLPLALIMFAVAVAWFFTKAYRKNVAMGAGAMALIYLALTPELQSIFSIQNGLPYSLAPYIGGLIMLFTSAHTAIRTAQPKRSAAPRMHPISLDPQTPYTNMLLLANKMMSRLSGEIMILDMHFDTASLSNLARLVERNTDKYTKISVLTKKERLGDEFLNAYYDFKREMANRHVEFELKVMSDQDAAEQHERLLMDGRSAYKIPPLNIINKKSEHIVAVPYPQAEHRFRRIWQYATKLENLKSEQGAPSA